MVFTSCNQLMQLLKRLSWPCWEAHCLAGVSSEAGASHPKLSKESRAEAGDP